MKDFSQKVREARTLLKLNQEELGKLVGVSTRAVVAYETTATKPRASTLRKLAETLKVSVDYLTNDEIDDPLYGIEKQPFVEEARSLYGDKAAREIDFLMERNAALFAGGEISQDAKDAYFEAVMQAYLECKNKAKQTYGKKAE
ncbi:MAG: helix-turn-helix transcriptional regulator [Clostridia bacterium]|nr:helix-turn-helix transcriptional regulator [Clostridia bacterium]